MSLTTWLWGATQIDEAVDKATSELLPSGSEDIALNLEICDQIRSKSAPPKDAMRALKRRLNHKNPNVQLLTLGLVDVCIKNGGDHFLVEVASREFMDNLVSILKMPTLNIDVKNKILRLVQNWAVAFEGKSPLSYVGTVYDTLKNEGYSFPPKDMAVANSAMVDTQTAPEWIDSEVCLRCRTPFSFTNRKHHCRNCGQVFDHQCSSKVMPLPHFGITQDVRVCESCYVKLHRSKDKSINGDTKHRRHASASRTSRHRSARELADAELQRAIQLSLEEVGAAHGHRRPGYVPSQPSPTAWQSSEPPLVDHRTRPPSSTQDEEDDPDLKAAIEASLREATALRPSAPIATPKSEEQPFSYANVGYSQSYPPTVVSQQPHIPTLPNYDLEPMESDAILTFSQTVEQVQGQGGRDISRYPAVNELYHKANGLRPKLAMTLDDTDRKEKLLSEMHDKMSQAVKLYDRLLTQQVSNPSWRSPPQQSNYPHYNTVDGSYMHPQHTQALGYSAPQPAQAQTGYGASTVPAQPEYAPYYANSPAAEGPYQQAYAPQQAPSQPWQPYPVSTPVPQSPSQPQQFGHMPYQPTPQTAGAPPQTPIHQAGPPQWPQQQAHIEPPFQYTAPQQQQVYSASIPGPSQSNPQPASQHVQTPSVLPSSQPQYAVAPPQPMQSPPADQSQIYQQNPQPAVSPYQHHTLSRHNTATYSSPSPAANGVARHHTIAHTQVNAPPVLPTFPVPPTSNPQAFSFYGVPTSGIEQTEKKEALLIDL